MDELIAGFNEAMEARGAYPFQPGFESRIYARYDPAVNRYAVRLTVWMGDLSKYAGCEADFPPDNQGKADASALAEALAREYRASGKPRRGWLS